MIIIRYQGPAMLGGYDKRSSTHLLTESKSWYYLSSNKKAFTVMDSGGPSAAIFVITVSR